MISFVKGIYFDLAGRIIKMIEDLKGPNKKRRITLGIDPLFVANTEQMLRELNNHINQLVQSGDLDIDNLARNNLIKYNTFYERLLTIELFRYLIIINYGDAEAYFKRKIKRIYNEIKCSQVLPLVTTISNSENYYWALPSYDIIAVPAGEEKNLLNLPDLYHEMGHLIYNQYDDYLKGSFEEVLKKYYDDETLRVIMEQRAGSLITLFRDKLSRWKNSWIMEFACDLIATYLVGPAYAWTNLKLTTLSSGEGEIYQDSSSHPSDEARMRAIFYMLEKLGHEQEIQNIKSSWEDFLAVTQNPVPSHYDFIFPQTLIEKLANFVFQGCQDIGLSCYGQQLKEHKRPISKILNEAWEKICGDPDNFLQWEKEEIQAIGQHLIP